MLFWIVDVLNICRGAQVSQKFCNILVTRDTISAALDAFCQGHEGDELDCEMQSSLDTLQVLLTKQYFNLQLFSYFHIKFINTSDFIFCLKVILIFCITKPWRKSV